MTFCTAHHQPNQPFHRPAPPTSRRTLAEPRPATKPGQVFTDWASI